MVNIQNKIDVLASKTNSFLLPDRCRVAIGSDDDLTFSDGIIVEGDKQFRSYKDSFSIPCRVESSRAYRQADYEGDISSVFEYVVHFPLDFIFDTRDRVILDNGEELNIVKTDDAPIWNVTKSVLLLGADRFNG